MSGEFVGIKLNQLEKNERAAHDEVFTCFESYYDLISFSLWCWYRFIQSSMMIAYGLKAASLGHTFRSYALSVAWYSIHVRHLAFGTFWIVYRTQRRPSRVACVLKHVFKTWYSIPHQRRPSRVASFSLLVQSDSADFLILFSKWPVFSAVVLGPSPL